MMILLLLTTSVYAKNQYPQEWFKKVPQNKAYSWEILPQAAKKGEVILSKRTPLGVFSNFSKTPFKFKGRTYQSIEGFWQGMKFPDQQLKNDLRKKIKWNKTRDQVFDLSAFKAKEAGDQATKIMKKMKIDWVSFAGQKFLYWTPKKGKHYQLIVEAMKAKLQQTPGLTDLLKKTKELKLLPDHHQEKNVPPAWHYYQIWMDIRDSI